VIQVEALTIRYDDLTAVSSATLTVPTGSVFGLIGPNGAGKTSTIRAIVGLLVPDEGRCLVKGLDVLERPDDVRRLVGYMPDFFGVYDHLRVWEYLEFFGQLYGLGGAHLEGRIGEILDISNLGGKREAFIGGLSRGMKQRLCLARALVHDPEVLILDEPASGVDPTGRYEIRKLIRDLGDAGKTVLVSSHILPELADVCDSIAILERGVVVASGSLAEIAARVQPSRQLTLRILGGQAERAALALAGVAAVRKTETAGDEVICDLADDPEAVADVLEALVSAGVRIGSVAEHHTELEDLYLRLTHGELA
jgi:ABC-2 type transport system ATP-binding protein